MLKLRRGIVTQVDPLRVRVGDEERAAWADESLVGEIREGDELILNTEAQDLGLGSGGFDIVHVNLTRGLDAPGAEEATALKLNYTSLQHPVDPVEAREPDAVDRLIPVLVLSLHGQLAPAAWAAARAAPQLRVGYIQTSGGALPGQLSKDVAELRSAGSALRARDGGAGVWGRGRGAHGDRRTAGRGRAAWLGRRDRRPRPRDRRVGLGAGSRWDGGARHRSCFADPRPRDAARSADVRRRPPAATPRPEPPHRDRAADAARQRARARAEAARWTS